MKHGWHEFILLRRHPLHCLGGQLRHAHDWIIALLDELIYAYPTSATSLRTRGGAQKTRHLIPREAKGLFDNLLVHLSLQLEYDTRHGDPGRPEVVRALARAHAHLVALRVHGDVARHAHVQPVLHAAQLLLDRLLGVLEVHCGEPPVVVLQPHAVVAPDYGRPAHRAAGVDLGTSFLGCSWVAFGACVVSVLALGMGEGRRTEPVLRGGGGGEEAALGGRADWDGWLAVRPVIAAERHT